MDKFDVLLASSAKIGPFREGHTAIGETSEENISRDTIKSSPVALNPVVIGSPGAIWLTNCGLAITKCYLQNVRRNVFWSSHGNSHQRLVPTKLDEMHTTQEDF